MERKDFLANPEHQYHVSQCGEHDCGPNHKMNRGYNENPSVTYFTNEL